VQATGERSVVHFWGHGPWSMCLCLIGANSPLLTVPCWFLQLPLGSGCDRDRACNGICDIPGGGGLIKFCIACTAGRGCPSGTYCDTGGDGACRALVSVGIPLFGTPWLGCPAGTALWARALFVNCSFVPHRRLVPACRSQRARPAAHIESAGTADAQIGSAHSNVGEMKTAHHTSSVRGIQFMEHTASADGR
jgi:hypothetical protein